MVGHNPNHDEDPITQAMVRVMKDLKEDHPLVQAIISNYVELCRLVTLDPDADPHDEIGRYEYVLSRWKPN
jgi:hypothetical protein